MSLRGWLDFLGWDVDVDNLRLLVSRFGRSWWMRRMGTRFDLRLNFTSRLISESYYVVWYQYKGSILRVRCNYTKINKGFVYALNYLICRIYPNRFVEFRPHVGLESIGLALKLTLVIDQCYQLRINLYEENHKPVTL